MAHAVSVFLPLLHLLDQLITHVGSNTVCPLSLGPWLDLPLRRSKARSLWGHLLAYWGHSSVRTGHIRSRSAHRAALWGHRATHRSTHRGHTRHVCWSLKRAGGHTRHLWWRQGNARIRTNDLGLHNVLARNDGRIGVRRKLDGRRGDQRKLDVRCATEGVVLGGGNLHRHLHRLAHPLLPRAAAVVVNLIFALYTITNF